MAHPGSGTGGEGVLRPPCAFSAGGGCRARICPVTEIKVRKRKPRLPRTGPCNTQSGLACPVPVRAMLELEL